jgi:phage shock protein A
MALLTRIARLLRADIHAVLDGVEEPDLVLKESIREMEAAVADEARRLGALEAELRRLEARREASAAARERLAEELDVCFAGGDEALARGVLRRRLEAERLERALAERRDALAEQADALERQLAEHRAELEEVRAEADARNPASEAAPTDRTLLRPAVTEAAVEVALLGERQRRAVS